MDARPSAAAPTIVVTVADPAAQSDPSLAERKNALYVAAVERHGGRPVLVHASTPAAERTAAIAAMNGLLLSGGADLDPAHYGQPVRGATGTEPDRDALEREAFDAADEAGLPVLGICRGLQALNVFMGGSLVQDVAGHVGRPYGSGPALTHPLRVAPGTRLARILFPTNVRGGVLDVNSYHHQAVIPAGLSRRLVAAGWATSPIGDLVEALESPSGPLRIGVQCHIERTESTPPAFERVFRVFVDACRGAVVDRASR